MSKVVFTKDLPFARFETHNEKPDFDLIHLTQVHSNLIVNSNQSLARADGLRLSLDFKKPSAIITADCLPIAIQGEVGHAFIHAGWRGLAEGILNAPEIIEIKPIYFFIGPHISVENYEIKEDFLQHFKPGNYFIYQGNKLYFDMAAYTLQLVSSCYPEARAESANICTFSHPDLHSYRSDGTAARNWNVLIPFIET
jgi:copper oxidase (laccase) domain-containing protein